MQEYFGGDDFYGGGAMDTFKAWASSWWGGLVVGMLVVVLLMVVLHFGGWVKLVMHKEGLDYGAHSLSIRGDRDSTAEGAGSLIIPKEPLIEAGREPNDYHYDVVDLATQLALRNTIMGPTAAAAEVPVPAPAKAAFTERMTPEEELKQKQYARAGLPLGK